MSIQSAGLASTVRRLRAGRGPGPTPPVPEANLSPASWDERHDWVLVVDSSLPEPDRDSGSLRLVNLIQILLECGHRVVFIADDGRSHGPYAEALRRLGVHIPDLSGPTAMAAWVRRHGASLRSAILCRHYVAGHWIGLVRATAPSATVVFDTVDLHFQREQREADLRGDQGLRRLAEGTRRRELALVDAADVTWVVSPVEQTLLQGLQSGADVRVLSNIIDADADGKPFAQRDGLVFVGGTLHPPNRDAVQWLVREIHPAIRRELPHVELHLVGLMTPEVRSMVESVAGVRAHGQVRDIEPFMSQCRVALAPLRFGAGVKGKINLSMAHGQPVVSTSCGVEGMHLQPGDDVLVADDVADFAAQVVRLYRDPALWQRLAEAGRDNVRRHFSKDIARHVITQTLERRHA